MWLGDSRGHVFDWVAQRWVQATGRRLSLGDHPWLDGPVGKPTGIGEDFFDVYARDASVQLVRQQPSGLLPAFDQLAGPRFDARAIARPVAEFYERTSEYDLDAWSHWCGAFRPFGGLLAVLFSRRLQQLNVPLSGLDASRGMTSEVFSVRQPSSQTVLYAAWIRRLVGTGA